MPEEHIELDLDDAFYLCLQLIVGRERGDDWRHELRRGATENGGGETFLGAEVVVEERLVDARFIGDFLRAGASATAAEENAMRRIEDALLGAVRRGAWSAARGA